MSTLSAIRPAVKPQSKPRLVRIISGLNGENYGTIAIAADQLVTHYEVARNDCSFGDAWELAKIVAGGHGPKYNILLCGQESNCDCAGWTYADHCKHCDALNALATRGLLN